MNKKMKSMKTIIIYTIFIITIVVTIISTIIIIKYDKHTINKLITVNINTSTFSDTYITIFTNSFNNLMIKK